MSEEKRALTKGEQVVRVSFNPSADNKVDVIKAKIAEVIDYVVENGKDPRLNSIALTQLETAAMFAVKSLTA